MLRDRINGASLYLIAILLTLIILMGIYYTDNFDYRIPYFYSQDGLFFSAVIKSLIDSKSYWTNPFLSAPFFLNVVEYPIFTPYNYIFVLLLSLFSKNFGSIINSYYYASYFFTTVIALFTFRKLGLNRSYALVASLLFSFTPFHMLRAEPNFGHLSLCNLFLIPIFILIAIIIYHSEKLFRSKAKPYIINGLLCCMCILGACCSKDFSFFGCFLLLLAGIVASLEKKRWVPLVMALFFISVTSTAFLVVISPTISKNRSISITNPRSSSMEPETYSLKITQLLFPVDQHRIKSLNIFKDKYNLTAPSINENSTASLGIIGSIGFLILLSIFFFRRWQAANNILFFLAVLNLGCLLIGSIAGFGSILAYTLTDAIKAYNRISVFISFLSLSAFFLVLQMLHKNLSINNRLFFFFLPLLILIAGLCDQIPNLNSKKYYLITKQSFIDDDNFIKQIEKIMPHSSLIFQLPYIPYPEYKTLYNMADHQHFRAYLHSQNLRWSYGASDESGVGNWQEFVSVKPVANMLRNIGSLGFTGIYINRLGYSDNAKKLEKELFTLTHTTPITNGDGTLAFYNLTSYMNKLKLTDPLSWGQYNQKVNHLFFLSTHWLKGFYMIEKDDQMTWRWCGEKKGAVKIINITKNNLPVQLSFKLQSASKPANISLSGDLINERLKVNIEGVLIKKEVMLKPGTNALNFETNAKNSDLLTDPRPLYFKVINFSIMESGT